MYIMNYNWFKDFFMKQIVLRIIYRFLALCSRIYLWRTKPIVIGVTWSVGKTSCRMVIAQVLSEIGNKRVYTSPKNFNSEIGLTLSIFEIESFEPNIKNLIYVIGKIFIQTLSGKKTYDILVAEYGIDTPGDMDFLLQIMIPDIAVLTKLDSVHSDNFPGGIPQLWQDKWKLLLAAKQKSYCNIQDDYAREHILTLNEGEYIFEDTEHPELTFDDGKLQQSFKCNNVQVSINLIGDESVEYTKLAFRIAKDIEIELEDNKYNFTFHQQAGRFTIFERQNNVFIDSSYNAGPESMKKVIWNTRKFQQTLYPDAKLLFVLGDMREIGDVLQEAHESIGEIVLDAEAIFTVGPSMYQYLLPKLKEHNFWWETHSSLSSQEIGKILKKYLKEHEESAYIVLFKGSQNTIFMEESLSPLLTPIQRKLLPRQSNDWQQKKESFFLSV